MANKRVKGIVQLALAVGFASIGLSGAGKQAQTAPKSEEQQFTPLIRSVGGSDLFQSYCASCHGLDARGAGPAASALKAKVPDLTILTRNSQGRFPASRMREVITGDKVVTAHGSREMPIWGPIFHQVEADMDWGNVRLENLVKYLESIQTIASSSPASGAELYARNCVACHGSNLKGGGAAPYPFRAPADLTTLALRHGGKFPEAYVSDVLRNGVILPVHGPAEMPIWGLDFAADRSGATALRIAVLTDYIKSRQVK